MLIQAGDDPGGIAALREAVRLDPDYAEAHANLGAALTPTDPEAAIRELEQAVALAPTLRQGAIQSRDGLRLQLERADRRKRSSSCER